MLYLNQKMATQCEKYLPEECWEIILKKLDHHSHFQSVSLVSKSFLALTNRLRLTFTLTNQTILFHGTISKFLNRFNHLKTLDFRKYKGNNVDPILNTVFKCGLNIEYLDVSNQENLPVLTKNMRNLKVFKCANVCLINSDLVLVSVMLPFLEELDISYPNHRIIDSNMNLDEFAVTDVGIMELWSSLKKLRRVNISCNHFITDHSMVGLSMNCLLLSEIVMLDCSQITEDACHFILTNCRHLNVISVNRIQIPPRVSSTYVRALRSIDLSDSFTFSDECLISIAKAGWSLESLSLCRCTSITLFGISQLLSAYRSLKHLALVNALFLTEQSVGELAQYLVNLVSINLDSCFRLTTLTFVTLVTECPLLEHINMSRTSVGNVDHSLVVKNKYIKSLNLLGNSLLSDESLKCIASTCPNMEVLNISSTYHTTKTGIVDVLKICHGIRNLQITNCAGISSLGAGLRLPTLEVLNVARSGFGDEGLKTISQRCPGLLKLDMEGCVAATTKQVEEILRMCERLREINLKGCCSVKALSVTNWIVSLRRSYLKVIPPSTLPLNSCRRHLWSHGCLLE